MLGMEECQSSISPYLGAAGFEEFFFGGDVSGFGVRA